MHRYNNSKLLTCVYSTILHHKINVASNLLSCCAPPNGSFLSSPQLAIPSAFTFTLESLDAWVVLRFMSLHTSNYAQGILEILPQWKTDSIQLRLPNFAFTQFTLSLPYGECRPCTSACISSVCVVCVGDSMCVCMCDGMCEWLCVWVCVCVHGCMCVIVWVHVCVHAHMPWWIHVREK